MAERIRSRAVATLAEYRDDLGFSTPDNVTIEIRCEIRALGVVPLGAPGLTESEELVKLRADHVRRWMLDPTNADPNATWKTLVDHELQHTIQVKARSLVLPFLNQFEAWYRYSFADATNMESAAQLAQDLIEDSDDAPELAFSYLDLAGDWLADPTTIAAGPDDKDATGRELKYRAAPFFQYLGERYGTGATPEKKEAEFLRRLYGTYSGTNAIGLAAPASPYDLLRDFYVTARVRQAPNATEYPDYQLLDEILIHDGLAPPPPPPPVPPVSSPVAVRETKSLATAQFLGQHLEHAQGAVYVVNALNGASSVRVKVGRSPLDLLTQRTTLLAFIPTASDGSVFVDASNLPDGPVWLDDSWVVPVAGQSELAIVIVAGDTSADFDLTVENAAGTSAMDFLRPTAADPAPPLESACPHTYIPVTVRPTVDGTFEEGLAAAAFTATLDGAAVPVTSAFEQPDSYLVYLRPATKPSVGDHPITMTFSGVTAPQAGRITVVQTTTCSTDRERARLASLGTLGQGDQASADVPVSAGDAGATFALSWSGSDFDLTLTSPSSRIITETTVAGDVDVVQGSSSVEITLDDPEAGTWTVQATGVDVPSAEAVTYELTEIGTAVRSELSATAQGGAGDPIAVGLALTHDSVGLTDATVEATLTDPAGIERHFPLFDDGGHGDTGPNDGVYGTFAWATEPPGSYHVVVIASGTRADGSTVERHEEADVALGPKVDTDGDGVADFSESLFGLDPAEPADGAVDFDGDGLGLAGELAAGLDPTSWDTDGGGENDASELAAGRDPRRPGDDLAFPSVFLSLVAEDGNLVSISTATSNETGQIHLYRFSGASRTDLGLRPGSDSTFDDGPLPSGTYRYAAVAVDAAAAESAPHFAPPVEVSADVTPPFVRISANDGAWATNGRDARIVFTDLTEPVIEMRLAESEADLVTAPWVPYANPTVFTIGPAEGRHFILAQVRDAAGNVSGVASAIVDLDTVPPESSVSGLQAATSVTPIDISFAASDDGTGVRTVELYARSRPSAADPWGAWTLAGTAATSPISYSFSAGDGLYEFYTVAIDLAGNREAAPEVADAAIALDQTPPSSSAGPVNSSYSTPTATVPYVASDDISGVTGVELWSRYRATSSDPWGSWTLGPTGTSSPITYTFGANGFYEFYTIAIDAAGNREAPPASADAATQRISAAVTTSRVSESTTHGQGNGVSDDSYISADGRHVTYRSTSSNLVDGDTNGVMDVFVHDRLTETTSRASVDAAGVQGNAQSDDSAISADGRYVVFKSQASNFVAGDTNGTSWDIFRKDLQTGAIVRASTSSTGTQSNGASHDPVISADGRYVAFRSSASNLVTGDTNGQQDIFRKDVQTGTTTLVSVSSAGVQGNALGDDPQISDDGNRIAFHSDATNLVASDTNAARDVFVRDLTAGTTVRVSVSSSGTQGNGASAEASISGDGTTVAYQSDASNLVASDTNAKTDVFVRVLATGVTSRVSVSGSGAQQTKASEEPSLSGDGTIIAFDSLGSSLVSGDTNSRKDIFIKDLATGTVTRMSIADAGVQGNDTSRNASLSADGTTVAFESDSTNLVANDTNATQDVFVRGPSLTQ